MKKFIFAVVSVLSLVAHADVDFTSSHEHYFMDIDSDQVNPILSVRIDIRQLDTNDQDKIVVELDTDKKDCYGIGKIKAEYLPSWAYYELKLTKACKGAKVKSASILHYSGEDKKGGYTFYFKPEGNKFI